MTVEFLITGCHGQLGRAVQKALHGRRLSFCATDLPELAVEDLDQVRRWLDEQRPRRVLHCGALTDVDGCERDPELAERINGTGTANIARACREVGAGLVYVSTDFVFDGSSARPYREDDEPNPLSVYGRSKWLGERAVLEEDRPDWYVVRTSWVFGPGGRNFPAAILARARSGQPLKVVTDQVGCPTLTDDLAAAMLDLCEKAPPGGIYHASNEGPCSWHEFAREILADSGLGDVEVGTMTSAELGRPAPRPAYSVLDCAKLAAVRGRRLPDRRDALRRYLEATEK